MSALAGLRQLGQMTKPRTLKVLMDAGTVTPLTPVAIALSLPWLAGRGPTLGVAAQMNAISCGNRPALHDRFGTMTWRQLNTSANIVASALRASGVTPGDRIGLLLRNGREFAAVLLGAQKLGAVACPFNTWAGPAELRSSLAQSAPRLVVYDTAHAKELGAALETDIQLVAAGNGDSLEDSITYEDFIARGSARPLFPFTLDRGSARVVIHTSGTTGTPKGAERDSSAAGLSALANLLTVVPYRRNDVIVCPAPMFHSFGLATFTFATAIGATVVLPEKFDPEEALRLIESHRATAASFVPVMIQRIVALGEAVRKFDLSSLRIVLASGSAMSPQLRRAASDLFGDVLYDLYGSTEVGWVTIAGPGEIKARPASVGKAVPGIDIAVFSTDGDRLPANTPGEIFVRSEVLFEGYTNGESRPVRDGYVSIGDVGRLDEDGYLYIEGRADDMVVVGGENVYPIEVEHVIESLKGVEEVAVAGVEDDEFGQVLAAFVAGSATRDEIVAVCSRELASYKVPRRIEILEELPRTSTGKILKRELIARLTHD